MIRTVVFAAAFASLPAPLLAAQDEAPPLAVPVAEVALARQIVDLGFPEDRREAMYFATMDQLVTQMRAAAMTNVDVDDEGANAILDRWIEEYVAESKQVLRSHIPSLMDALAHSYAAIFTEEELRDILAFVSTPSGQRFMELSPAIMAEPNFAAANQAYMNDIASRLPAAREDLMARLIEYFTQKQAKEAGSES